MICHFSSAVSLKKQLIRDNFPSVPYAITEDLKKVGNTFPFINEVGRVHKFETLERHKPELRKETYKFLIENVLEIPVAVLKVVAKFVV